MKIHHIGIVTADIENACKQYADFFDFKRATDIVTDPIHKSKLVLLANGDNSLSIELIEPVGEDSPVADFLNRGGGLHHICYETRSLVQSLNHMRSLGALLVSGPSPAVLFDGRPVVFVYTRSKELVEFVENPQQR